MSADRVRLLVVGGMLLLAVGLVFGQTAAFDFVNYDDDKGVYENPLVTRELSSGSVRAIFAERHLESWCPLTCLSHMLVWHLFGHGPAAHHLTNLLLYAASVVLLFLVLQRMTGRLWPSALAAAIFAVHPLRAESVAWVTERKDVLSGLFFVLTLAAYLHYVRAEKIPFPIFRYLTVLACFAIGLAAKPMAVTLPFVLLLLDYWPLGRFGDIKPRSTIAPSPARSSIAPFTAAGVSGTTKSRSTIAAWWRLLAEKIPLLAIAGLFCLLAVRGQTAVALEVSQGYGLGWRIENALISYVAYLGQFVCPASLAAYYPRRPLSLPPWQVLLAAGTLAAITAASIGWRRRRYLLVGWLWYVGMLVPVIGLVQFGAGAEADRFTYLPQIGLAIGLAWAAADAGRRAKEPGTKGDRETRESRLAADSPRLFVSLSPCLLSAVASTCVLTALIVAAWRQTSYWCESKTLWTHALACTSQNMVAHNNLGFVLADCGRSDEALAHYKEALKIKPDYAEAQYNLGVLLARQGQIDEALACYRKAVKIKPDYAEAQYDLGFLLAGRGQIGQALACYRKAVEIRPDFVPALNNLAWLRATRPEARLRDATAAIELARRAAGLTGGSAPGILDTLAAAYAEAGMFSQAQETARQALILARQQHNDGLVETLLARLRLYDAGKPYRQPLQPSAE